LGIDANADYQEHRFDGLRACQILVLATDGLWEAKNNRGEKLGLDRLCKLLSDCAHLPAGEIRERVARAEQAFGDGGPQSDDISFVIIKVTDTGIQ